MIKDLIRKVFRPRRVIEQHIAVFGESGSGKTTLLSTFYGWHQEPFFRRTAGYSLLADDTSQGQRLLKQYFKMKESLLPPPTRYQHQAFKFNITVRGLDKSAGSIVWHDYPGEWWTETKTDAEEKKKIEAFRTLLKSDIAFFLCDAQILREEGGKYLKRLFGSFRGELERQKSAIVSDNKPLQSFPRVWVICLSKSDLMPDKDVYWFRGEIYKSAIDELEELREVLKMMLAGDDYQSIGEDFLLLSSAKFDSETGKIVNPEQNIGI
ncbi:MAG: ATP/GTP-binding protein, partial [Leptolyngbya sp. DLM2.Bin15]